MLNPLELQKKSTRGERRRQTRMRMYQDDMQRLDTLARGQALRDDAMQWMGRRLKEHQSLIQRAQSQSDSTGGKLAKLRESVGRSFRALSDDLRQVGEALEEKIDDNWRRTAEIEDVESIARRCRKESRSVERKADRTHSMVLEVDQFHSWEKRRFEKMIGNEVKKKVEEVKRELVDQVERRCLNGTSLTPAVLEAGAGRSGPRPSEVHLPNDLSGDSRL